MTLTVTRYFVGLFASLLLLSAESHARGYDSAKKVLDFGNSIIMDISQVHLDDAWRKMKAHSNIPPSGIDNFGRQYRAHYDQAIRHYGPSVGVELMKTEMAGNSFIRATYLVKYEATAITWFMIFYKVRDTWVLNEFNYDILSNANFIVTSVDAGTPPAPSLSQSWQNTIERRLSRIEQQTAPAGSESRAGGAVPMVRSVTAGSDTGPVEPDQDSDTLDLLRQLEERLARLEDSPR